MAKLNSTSIEGNLSVSEKISAENLETKGTAVVKDLNASGTITTNNETINNNLTVKGVAVTNTLQSNGKATLNNAEISSSLSVGGGATFDETVRLKKGFYKAGDNSITSTSSDTPGNWGQFGNSIHFYSQPGQLINQPSNYGWLVNITNGDSECSQLWFTQPNGQVFRRGGNGQGWSGTWRILMDNNNYSNYAISNVGEYWTYLPSNTHSTIFTVGEPIDSNIGYWSKGILMTGGGQDAGLISVDAAKNLTWGYRANGDWIGTRSLGQCKRLWSGGHYMTQDQEIYLSEAVSDQANGIVLTFEAYRDGAGKNYEYHHFFVPKTFVANAEGAGSNFVMTAPNFTYNCTKYLYIRNTSILGNYRNTSTGTNSGITFTNHAFVLSAVYGV